MGRSASLAAVRPAWSLLTPRARSIPTRSSRSASARPTRRSSARRSPGGLTSCSDSATASSGPTRCSRSPTSSNSSATRQSCMPVDLRAARDRQPRGDGVRTAVVATATAGWSRSSWTARPACSSPSSPATTARTPVEPAGSRRSYRGARQCAGAGCRAGGGDRQGGPPARARALRLAALAGVA